MKPQLNFSLDIRGPDSMGLYSIVSTVPGLILAGHDLTKLLASVPVAVNRLRQDNGDERRPDPTKDAL